MRIPSCNRKNKEHADEVGDDAREPKKEGKGEAVLLQKRLMLEPGQRTQKVADKRGMIEQDAVFVNPRQAVGVDRFRELVEGKDVVRS